LLRAIRDISSIGKTPDSGSEAEMTSKFTAKCSGLWTINRNINISKMLIDR